MTDHQDSQLAEAQEAPLSLSPEALDEIVDVLGVVEPTLRSQLRETLLAEAESYLLNRSVEPHWGVPGEQRKAFRQLLKRLDGTLNAMDWVAS